MAPPLAYFLTWTTYGTRLHGDSRGTVDREHNRVGQPFLAPDHTRRTEAFRNLAQQPYTLSADAQLVVEATVQQHTNFRAWRLLALTTLRTHVHVVVDCRLPGQSIPKPPEDVMKEYKSWSTRALRRGDLIESTRRVWTNHGSTRWLNHESDVIAAIDYVSRLQ